MAVLAINGPYGHGQQHCQHGCYGYTVKTYAKTSSSVLDSANLYYRDIAFKDNQLTSITLVLGSHLSRYLISRPNFIEIF